MKRLSALIVIALFLGSVMQSALPVQAHFTLGNISGAYSYEINNFDPHVAGPIGYVWPGGGQCTWNGFPNQASDNCSPGYQSPYPNGNPPNAPSSSWYQLQGDTYAPFGAVLTNSTGDLIFALNATCTPDLWVGDPLANGCALQSGHDNGVRQSEIQDSTLTTDCSPNSGLQVICGWDTWVILIPPEFIVPGTTSFDPSQITSTLSNSYNRYLVAKLGPDDRYAPNWTLIVITTDANEQLACIGQPILSPSFLPNCNINFHQLIQFTHAGEWYYVRINGVTAPSIAGRYFFKMGLYSQNDYFGVGPTLAGAPGVTTSEFGSENPFLWVPPQNWPVLLVKGEVDPAIITGTVRYAGYNATLYGHSVAEAGRVWAHMVMRLDPYTGQERPDLPTIDAQAYLNATANGHFEIEGLASGVYDIYAELAGYPQTSCKSGVTILKGQSSYIDCYVQPGPVIHGDVFSKHLFGDEPWPGNSTTGQYVKIGLYDSPTLSNIVDPTAGGPVSWSPLPCTAGGQENYYGRRAAGFCADPRDGSAIAFPWHEYSTVYGPAYNDPQALFTGMTNGFSRDVSIGPGTTFSSGSAGSSLGVDNLLASDPEGVGPPQHWFVQGGTTAPFHFEFGVKGEFGAPRDFSGEVPQVYATWINGLTPGRYYVRAWTFRYVQTTFDGSTFQEYYFDITPNEWAGDVTLPIDLQLSSWVNKTVYFQDTPNTTMTDPVHSGAGYIWGYLRGADGHVYAANVTGLGLLEQNTTGIGEFLTPGQTVHPTYYYSYAGMYRACFSYDQFSDATGASNYGTFQTGENGAPSRVCPYGDEPGEEVSALDKAGLNANSIATGEATIQFWGINDTWGGENYGIPSGTYAPIVGADGYYSPTTDQVSITLSGNPTSVSDHLFLAPGFNVSIYSVDWELPRVTRNWVWSGCQVFEYTYVPKSCIGSEIDVGFYPVTNGVGGALADWFGYEPTYLPPSVNYANDFGGLFQGPGGTDCVTGNSPSVTCAQMDGGGRNVLSGYSYHGAYFGQSADRAFVGGSLQGSYGFLRAVRLRDDSLWTAPFLVWPSHFKEGQYDLAAYTYGYIQNKDFSVNAADGQVADMKIDLIVGVNVTLSILFEKEHIISGTPFNMSARVRLFNDQGQLVATWMSSEGVYVDRSGHAIAANGALNCPAGWGDLVGTNCFPTYPFINQGGSPFTTGSSPANGYNFLPGGVNTLNVLMAGLPQQVPLGANDITGYYFSDPIFSAGFISCDFELDCYPSPYGRYPFPYTGIAGAPDYSGSWTAEVDFVPWFTNNTITTAANSTNSFGWSDCEFSGIGCGGQYFPPVDGLLMGESYHIIPGTAATSGISLTEDTALTSTFTGHTMAPNHLGPYSQEGVWQIAGTHDSGETSGIFVVDLNGFVSGNVLGFTWSNEFRPLSWGALSVSGAQSMAGSPFSFYTYDGIYQTFLPPGTYQFTISSPGYTPQSWPATVSAGMNAQGQNIYLKESSIPVPEFSSLAIAGVFALGASVYVLRRRRK